MKKINFSAVAVVLAGSLLLSSCIGSFSLFNKYEKWQCNMSSSHILNGIVGLVLQPICAPICAVVDALVLCGQDGAQRLQDYLADGRRDRVQTQRKDRHVVNHTERQDARLPALQGGRLR